MRVFDPRDQKNTGGRPTPKSSYRFKNSKKWFSILIWESDDNHLFSSEPETGCELQFAAVLYSGSPSAMDAGSIAERDQNSLDRSKGVDWSDPKVGKNHSSMCNDKNPENLSSFFEIPENFGSMARAHRGPGKNLANF